MYTGVYVQLLRLCWLDSIKIICTGAIVLSFSCTTWLVTGLAGTLKNKLTQEQYQQISCVSIEYSMLHEIVVNLVINYFGKFGSVLGSLAGIPLSTSISFTVGKEESMRRAVKR